MKDEMRFHYQNRPEQFFEGWYYKCTDPAIGNFAVIAGISQNEQQAQAFIQIAHSSAVSGYYAYPISAFHYREEPFRVQIGDNVFTKEQIHVKIASIGLELQLRFTKQMPLPHSVLQPSIMGPLLYLPYLPCYHHIAALRSEVQGMISMQGSKTEIKQAYGYIEKDYGVSFPSGYAWAHGCSKEAMFVVAVAMVPFEKNTERLGFFAVLQVQDKIYRFSSYQLGMVRRFSHYQSKLYIEVEQCLTQVSFHMEYQDGCMLKAPKQGGMDAVVEESLHCKAIVVMERRGTVLFDEVFDMATSEVFEYANMKFKQT